MQNHVLRNYISEFEASLVYRASSRTARAIQRNPVLKHHHHHHHHHHLEKKKKVSLCSPGCPGTHSVDQAGL